MSSQALRRLLVSGLVWTAFSGGLFQTLAGQPEGVNRPIPPLRSVDDSPDVLFAPGILARGMGRTQFGGPPVRVRLLHPEPLSAMTDTETPPRFLPPHGLPELSPVERLAIADLPARRKAELALDNSPFPWVRAGVVCLCGGTLLGGLCLVCLGRRENPDATLDEDAPSQLFEGNNKWLRPLIANRMPIEEEAPVLPPLARLHGTPRAAKARECESLDEIAELLIRPATAPVEVRVPGSERHSAIEVRSVDVNTVEGSAGAPWYLRREQSAFRAQLPVVEGDFP